MALGLFTASPAAAAEFNCFKWVAATASHVLHPHHHRVHGARAIGVKAVARPHTHRMRPIATHYVRRPVACPAHEIAALASPVPGVPAAAIAPQTGPEILAGLAGPPAAVDDTAREAAALAPEAPPPTESGFPGGFPEGPTDDFTPIVGFPTPVGPPITAPPIIGPPVIIPPTPPIDVFPPILPPETPPVTVVTPPGTVFPPPLLPPGGPGPGTGSVPEPLGWALMVLGFGGMGAALRRRRASLRA